MHTCARTPEEIPLCGSVHRRLLFFKTSGVGAGAGSSIFGFLTHSTRPEERAAIFAAIMACRQVGLVVGQFRRRAAVGRMRLLFESSLSVSTGPAFNLFLRLCDFKLGPFVVNKYTSPGVTVCRRSSDAVSERLAAIWLCSHFPCSDNNSEFE